MYNQCGLCRLRCSTLGKYRPGPCDRAGEQAYGEPKILLGNEMNRGVHLELSSSAVGPARRGKKAGGSATAGLDQTGFDSYSDPGLANVTQNCAKTNLQVSSFSHLDS
jgi:hypothetical protein